MSLKQIREDILKKLKLVEEDRDNCLIIKNSVSISLYKGSLDDKYYQRCLCDIVVLKAKLSILDLIEKEIIEWLEMIKNEEEFDIKVLIKEKIKELSQAVKGC